MLEEVFESDGQYAKVAKLQAILRQNKPESAGGGGPKSEKVWMPKAEFEAAAAASKKETGAHKPTQTVRATRSCKDIVRCKTSPRL